MTGTTSTAKRPVPRAPIPLRVSNPGADPRVTRQRARRDGYVFCRALVPRDRIDALRGHALAVAEDLGWLDANAPRNAALAVGGARLGAYDDPRWIAFLRRVLPHPTFAAVRVAPAVVAVLTAILDAQPQSDAGDLCRVVSSDDPAHTTVAHQDHFYLPGGAPRWSMWVPLAETRRLAPWPLCPSTRRGSIPTLWRRVTTGPTSSRSRRTRGTSATRSRSLGARGRAGPAPSSSSGGRQCPGGPTAPPASCASTHTSTPSRSAR